MSDEAQTLGFGVTFDTIAAGEACGQLVSLTFHRGGDENPPHRHVNDYLCIVLAGGFAERHRGDWWERRNGSFFAHQAGETHHDRFGEQGAVCLNLHFSSEARQRGRIEGRCSPSTRIMADQLAFQITAKWQDELVMASLAAQILSVFRTAPEVDDFSGWFGRVVEAISDEPRRRWSLGELAEVAERHPVRLAQAFHARTGMSLGAFQRLRRLNSLSLALRGGTDSLAMLAAEFGYFDQAHMNAEFRAAFGVSPGRYRRDWH